MTLIKVKNNPENRSVARQPYLFNELFTDFFDNMLTNSNRQSTPAVNVSETDDQFTLEVAAPGLKKEAFKINVDNDLLTVSAENKEEKSEKNEKYNRREFSYSSFQRSFNIPEMIDTEKISANYQDGVITIVLPKREEAKPKPAREIKIA